MPSQESAFDSRGHPLSRYSRFSQTMAEDMGFSEDFRLHRNKQGGLPSKKGTSVEAQKFEVQELYRIGGFRLRINYTPQAGRNLSPIQFPVESFTRYGLDHSPRWSDFRIQQEYSKTLVKYKLSDRTVYKALGLPTHVAFPRVVASCRLDPDVKEMPERLSQWETPHKINGVALPPNTVCDEVRYDGFFETWTQIPVVILDSASMYNRTDLADKMGASISHGMLTSPSMTFHKLGLWKELPNARDNSRPVKEILFTTRIPDQFEERELDRPYRKDLEVHWNPILKRIEMRPPTPPSSPPQRVQQSCTTMTLSHRQQLYYGQRSTGRGEVTGPFAL